MPKQATDSAIMMQRNPNSPASEAYRSLRFNIDCSVFGREAKTLLSPLQGEVKENDDSNQFSRCVCTNGQESGSRRCRPAKSIDSPYFS